MTGPRPTDIAVLLAAFASASILLVETTFAQSLYDDYGWDSDYGYSSFDETRDPRLEWLFAPVRLESERLDNENKRIMNSRERIINDRHEMVNDWMDDELTEFKRYIYQLAGDEHRLRAERDRLGRQAKGLRTLLSGKTNALGTQALLQLVGHCQPDVLPLFHEPVVPMVAAQEFRCEGFRFLGPVLSPDGQLSSPPRPLRSDRFVNDLQACGKGWANIYDTLRTGELPRENVIGEFETHVADWQHHWESCVAEWSPSDRTISRRYFAGLRGLVRQLDQGQKVERLHRQLAGNEFAGGSLAELIDHVVQRRLSVPVGSPAHPYLAAAGKLWLAQIDLRRQSLNERIETLKSQNPSHQSALEAWAESASDSYGVGGSDDFDY